MPEFIHNFTRGKMESDLDERMVPNGSYRDALNVTVSTSEASNVGALQNLKGNTERKGKPNSNSDWSNNYISDLTNATCIGSIRHEPTECIYWFIASEADRSSGSVSVIAEFNQKTNKVRPVLVDTKNILKFTKNDHITGINIVENLLFFTDNKTEPKKINIEKFKKGSVNFVTHTKVSSYNTSTGEYGLPLGSDFAEEDVTVIKKSPITQPVLIMSDSLVDGPGTGTDPVTTTYSENNYYNFTYITEEAVGNQAAVYAPLPTYQTYQEAVGTAQAYPTNMEFVNIVTSSVPTGWTVGETIVLTGSHIDDYNNVDEYTIRLEIVFINGANIKCKIQSIPSRILRFGADQDELIIWDVLLQEKDPMFEFNFPRFAYRWKYENGEYSTFSPFTKPAFIGDEFEYLSSDGFNLGMKNNLRSLQISGFDWGSPEVIELDILYKSATGNAIYVVDTLKDRNTTSFTLKSELIGAVVEANQILRPYDNVPRKALAQEISANRLIYANYLQNYNVPSVNLNLNILSDTHPGLLENGENDFRKPFKTIKSIRKYQLGIVFQDAYGRQTPVFTDANATITLDKDIAPKINKFSANVTSLSSTPDWITHYKYFIKDTSNEYYNLALDRFYFAEDGNVWLSFPSSERNKVQIDSYLILKKQHDVDTDSIGPCRYKILDIQSKAPEFIANSKKIIASAQCQVNSGFQQDFSLINFTGPDADDNQNFATAFNGDSFVTISDGGNTTDILGVKFGGPISSGGTVYEVSLDEPFGSDASFFGPTGLANGTQVIINVFKNEEERLPEFEGRFFVKINRDTDFELNIVKTFSALEKRYGIVASVDVKGVSASRSSRGESGRWGLFFRDEGESAKNPTTRCSCPSSWRHSGVTTGGNGNRLDDFNGVPANSLVFIDGETGMEQAFYAGAATNRTYLGVLMAGFGNLSNSLQARGAKDFMLTKAVKGALVRVVHNDGRVTEPYEIKNHWRYRGRRGIRKCLCTKGCKDCQKDLDSNNVFSVALELEKPIQEDWVGNGTLSALANLKGFQIVEEVITDDNKILSSNNPAVFETEPKEAIDIDLYYEASDAFPISNITQGSKTLDYYNAYSFGNGVESDRIRDDFNAPRIGKGVKVSATLDEPYMEERRSNGLIFSQIYNSTSGINRLNQFIQAEPITKDLNPEYGSIQKLHSKNTNLVTLCEDKCLSILANKDALFNADGNVNVTSNKAVLGQAVPYAGEFGISTNPESFADYGFRSYFADKNRGTVIRLSQDGITQIALKGMSDFFSDNLPVCKKIIGSYNDDKACYNITLDNLTEEWQDKLSATPKDKTNCEVPDDVSDNIKSTTVSFKETVDGWTSRKSYYSTTNGVVFPLESGVSLNDKYYTFNKGLIWEHSSNNTYSNFYGTQYDCSVNVIINDVNESIKGFKTLNYSGTASRAYKYGTSTGLSNLTIAQIVDQQIAPNIINSETSTPGWYTNYINTDMEEGHIKEFVKKENKYFNKIKGLKTFYNDNCDNNVDSSAFPTQGIGFATVSGGTPTKFDLTIKLDTSCSTEGNVNPDTTKKFWYLWACTKPGSNDPGIDIRDITTDQLVKCGIEEFYNQFPNGYNEISKNYLNYKFYSSQGINVGTQLYNEDNTQVSSSGKFLYIDPASTPSNDALNANVSGTSVPNTYFIITITNGTISAKTQYNTLDDCSPAQPGATFRAHLGWFKVIPGQGNYFINFINATKNISNPGSRPAHLKSAIISWLNSNSIVNQNNLGIYAYNYSYLAGNGVAVGETLYKEDGTALDSNFNTGAFVYKTDQVFNGASTTGFAVNRYDVDDSDDWASLPNTYKIIVLQNGTITHVINMNSL